MGEDLEFSPQDRRSSLLTSDFRSSYETLDSERAREEEEEEVRSDEGRDEEEMEGRRRR